MYSYVVGQTWALFNSEGHFFIDLDVAFVYYHLGEVDNC